MFIKEKEIYRSTDALGEFIVSQCDNKRAMSFASSLQQSSVFIDKPHYFIHEYTQIMLLGRVFSQAKHITILGLGGGGFCAIRLGFYSVIFSK